MPSFAYTALDSSGKQVTGSLAVSTRAEAFRKLESQRLTPVKVSEEAKTAGAKTDEKKEDAGPPPVLKRALLIHFTEELADLLDGGLQLEQALRVMEERQDSPIVRRVSKLIRDQVREGAMFSKALQNASPSFDDLYRNLAAAGEASGSLPQILRRLSGSISQIHELQNRVTQAMIYPAMMIVALIGLITVLVTVLIPQLSSLLSKTGGHLPMGMQIMLIISNFFTHWWWLIIIALTAAFLSFRIYINTPKGRLWWDQAKLNLPLAGPVMSARFYAQFCGSLGNLVNNGVPLLNGLKLSVRATLNTFLRDLISKATAIVGEGASLSFALKKVGHLPTLMLDMIAVGEQTGNLGHSLDKVAQRYDKELDKRIKRMTAMITPVVIIVMAVIVGFVAYSVVTAIFQSMSGMKGRA
jgi:general secretion pathway protein F/type IV pilus assembly protein PilC